jgi:iron complex transport system permease protein
MNSWRGPALLGLTAALAALVLTALSVGAVKIPLRDIFGAVTGSGVDARFEGVLWHLRLPRVLLGIVVGATLSVAGAIIQGLFAIRGPIPA